MTAIYVTLFITGVVGNVATGVVIIRNRSMHTATNYYLFSLALSDLVILLLGELPGPRQEFSDGRVQGDHSGCSLGLIDIKTKAVYAPYTKAQLLL